jgi:chorismate mutase
MTTIPDDIEKTVDDLYESMASVNHAWEGLREAGGDKFIIALALLAERERCAAEIAALKVENERLREATLVSEPMFPIMRGPAVPWSLIAPYEAQARANHGQSLKRLAERGGLGISEAMAIMSEAAFRDRPIANPTVEEWLDFMAERKQRAATRVALEGK